MQPRLFHEIWSSIMILTQQTIVAETSRVSDPESSLPPPSQPFEILISHVNSGLRDIALHTSHLWSSIRIEQLHHDQRITLERTTAYIRRSGGHLLDVRIELLTGEKSLRGRWELDQTLELIATQSPRWRRLSIVADCGGIAGVGDTILACLTNAKNLVPELEYLSVSIGHEEQRRDGTRVADTGEPDLTPPLADSSSHNTFPQITLDSPPKLAFFRLRGLALYLFRLNRLSSLRVLHLDQTKALPISYAFFHSVMHSCPLLEHLSIYGDFCLDGHVGDEDGHISWTGMSVGPGVEYRSRVRSWRAIRLPELRSLRICGTRGLVYRILLSELEAPELESLVLKDVQEHDLDTLWEDTFTASTTSHSGGGSGGGLPGAFTNLTSRFTQMRSLIISNSDLSTFAYRQLFKVFPAITEFASYSSIEIDLAPKLFADDVADVHPPWPNLRTMTFIFNEDLEADEIMEMLNCRRKSGCPVQRLRIGVAEVDEEEQEEEEAGKRDKLMDVDAVVVVERMEEYDVWPPDRLHADVDDNLF